MNQRSNFPVDALPGWLADYVNGVAASLQVPLDMPAAFALGLLATAAARVADIKLTGDHVEGLNLFIGLIAPPGSRKSACAAQFIRPVQEMERHMVEMNKVSFRHAVIARQRLERELHAAADASDWDSAEKLQGELDDTPPPVVPQLFADDVTAQKLGSQLAAHGAMAILSAEPSIFSTMLGRWSGGRGMSELDVFLKGQAGDPIKVDRHGRPPDYAERPRLTMAVALQPEALRRLASSETAGRGLLGRFLWISAPDVRGSVAILMSQPVKADIRAEFEHRAGKLFSMEKREQPLTLTEDAEDLWIEFADDFEQRLAPGGDMRDLSGWGEKYRGAVGRIAGLLHLAGNVSPGAVTRAELEAAISIGRWLEGQALEAFAMMGLRADVRDAEAILEVVRREGWHEFSRRELHQKLKDRNGFKKVDALQRGLSALEHAELLQRRAAPPVGKAGGRPSMGRWVVSAHVHSDGFESFESYIRTVHARDDRAFEGFEGPSDGEVARAS